MQETVDTKTEPKASARDVLRAFWRGIQPYKYFYFLSLAAISAASVLQIVQPIYYKRFFDILNTATDKTTASKELVSILMVVLLIHGVRWVGYRIVSFTQNKYQILTLMRLKQLAFEYLIDHSYTFFANNFTGSLTQKVNRYARAFDRLTDRIIWSIFPLAINIVGVIAVLWFVNPVISLIIVAWIFAFIGFNYAFSRWKLKYDIHMAETDSKTTGLLSDNIVNHSAIQLFVGRSYEYEQFKGATNYQAQVSTKTWNLAAIVDGVQGALIIAAEILLFYYSVVLWRQGQVTIGTFVLIQTYFITLGDHLWGFARIIRDVYEAFADSKEMVDIMLTPHEIKDKHDARPLMVLDGEIEFKNLSFRFNESKLVLDDLSTTIQAGEKVALIGPSGAGKSTFVRLLLRLYDAASGEILIDGQNIGEVTQDSLRQAISLVPQDPVLFHRSLKENIRYGRRDATDEEVIEAAKLAHCDEFIKDLPKKYDTLVGERGIKLSGGERQRVAIARAILKNAPILILDEATSSLDSESEHYIQDALDTLMKGKTVIVIAHRLSTIRKMDRIIVIDNGKIREEGTHDSLLNSEHSLYKKLWNFQAGGFLQEPAE